MIMHFMVTFKEKTLKIKQPEIFTIVGISREEFDNSKNPAVEIVEKAREVLLLPVKTYQIRIEMLRFEDVDINIESINDKMLEGLN